MSTRIMDLSFPEALKYAFLGDAIYRLEDGRKSRVIMCNYPIYGPSLIPFNAGDAPIDGYLSLPCEDVVANDWIAEYTEKSV